MFLPLTTFEKLGYLLAYGLFVVAGGLLLGQIIQDLT